MYPHALEDIIDSGKLVDILLPTKPDLIILQSQMKNFVKEVNGSICVNPGYLCKSRGPGTYARIILYPNVDERIRTDLLKL